MSTTQLIFLIVIIKCSTQAFRSGIPWKLIGKPRNLNSLVHYHKRSIQCCILLRLLFHQSEGIGTVNNKSRLIWMLTRTSTRPELWNITLPWTRIPISKLSKASNMSFSYSLLILKNIKHDQARWNHMKPSTTLVWVSSFLSLSGGVMHRSPIATRWIASWTPKWVTSAACDATIWWPRNGKMLKSWVAVGPERMPEIKMGWRWSIYNYIII